MNDIKRYSPLHFMRRGYRNMVCRVVLFCLVSLLLPGTLLAATYYVDASLGSNSNNGTPSETDAWQTMAPISTTSFGVGDQILFKRGEVWHESLTVPADGVTIGAYPDTTDPLPIFDGTTTVSWVSQGGNIYTAPWVGGDPGMVIYKGASKPSIAKLTFNSDVSGVPVGSVLIQKTGAYCSFWVTSATTNTVSGITFFRDPAKHWIANVTDSIELRQLVNGREDKSRLTLTSSLQVDGSLEKDGDWYWDADSLYLYSSTTPNDTDVQVSALVTGIYAQGRQNLTIQDIAVQGFQGTGVHLDQTVDSTVQRVLVTNIGAQTTSHKTGIMLDHSSRNTIQNNTVDSVLRVGIGIYSVSAANPSQGNTISGNTIKNSGSSGISLNTDDSTTSATVTDNTITGNTILYSNRLAYDSAGVYAIFVGTGNSITNNTILYGGSKYLRSAGIMVDWGDDGKPPIVAPVSITGNRLENNSLVGIVVTGT